MKVCWRHEIKFDCFTSLDDLTNMQHRAVHRLHTLNGHLTTEHQGIVDAAPTKGQKIARPRLPLVLLPEVAQALAANRPVVALESTIISHGTSSNALPFVA